MTRSLLALPLLALGCPVPAPEGPFCDRFGSEAIALSDTILDWVPEIPMSSLLEAREFCRDTILGLGWDFRTKTMNDRNPSHSSALGGTVALAIDYEERHSFGQTMVMCHEMVHVVAESHLGTTTVVALYASPAGRLAYEMAAYTISLQIYSRWSKGREEWIEDRIESLETVYAPWLGTKECIAPVVRDYWSDYSNSDESQFGTFSPAAD